MMGFYIFSLILGNQTEPNGDADQLANFRSVRWLGVIQSFVSSFISKVLNLSSGRRKRNNLTGKKRKGFCKQVLWGKSSHSRTVCSFAILLLSILLPWLWPNPLPSSQSTSSPSTENINTGIYSVSRLKKRKRKVELHRKRYQFESLLYDSCRHCCSKRRTALSFH